MMSKCVLGLLNCIAVNPDETVGVVQIIAM